MRPMTEFARERGEEPNTVGAYIRRYKDKFEGHTFMDGKRMMLDDHALAILDEQYPMPQPVIVKEDFKTMQALAEAQAKVIELQDQILENADVVSQAKTAMALIGAKDDQIDKLELDLKDEKKMRAAANQKIETQQQEIQDLKNQLMIEKNRKLSWKERLFGIKESKSFLEQPATDACNAAVTTETEES